MKNSICTIIVFLIIISCKDNKPDANQQVPEQSKTEITIKTPAELGIDSTLFTNVTAKIENQEYPNIHSLLVMKNGALIYEKYFSGNDQNYGSDIGMVKHTDTTLHDLRSITKSIVSICVGIAIDQGLIKGVNQNISDFFPEVVFDGDKLNWTIQHFLTMTTGLAWDENVSYTDPKNDEIQMTYSKDPIAYVFNKPLVNEPGDSFNYSGGATQILAEIVERSSKTTMDEFVKKHLFLPLGIDNFHWNKFAVWGGADKFAAPSGLRLTSRDLLKIGLLLRNNGQWNGKQILSEDWVKESFTQKIEFPSTAWDGNDGYGYQFWMWPDVIETNDIWIVAAIGNGGQNIFWDLENDLIVVTTAGNYNGWDVNNDPYALVRNEIYPTLLKEKK